MKKFVKFEFSIYGLGEAEPLARAVAGVQGQSPGGGWCFVPPHEAESF